MTDFSASLEVAGLLERGGAEDKVENQTRKRVFFVFKGGLLRQQGSYL